MADDSGLDFTAPKPRVGRGRSYADHPIVIPSSIEDTVTSASLSLDAPITESFIEYGSATSEGSTAPFSTRIPQHWFYEIDSVREKINTRLPNYWKTRGDFGRWAIGLGIDTMRKRQQIIDSDNPDDQAQIDPITKAKMFMEHTVGSAAMRASTINDATERIDIIAKAVTGLIELDEPTEAADILNEWIVGAAQQESTFWRSFFGKILITHPQMREAVVILIREGHIVDEYTIALAEASGAMGETRQRLHNASVERSLDFTAPEVDND